MSAPKVPSPDEDVEIEIDEEYSDVEIEEEKETADQKEDKKIALPAARPATPHLVDATPAPARPATPYIAHNATAPTSSLSSLDVASVPSTASSLQPSASSLPHPLPSASSSPRTAEPKPASATLTSDSPLSSTAASAPTASQLHDSHAGNLSAVHRFSAPLQLGHDSTSNSALSLSSTAERQQQRTVAQLEQLVEALNADNARLLLQIKQRDAQIEQNTQQHARDKKRLRDECEQVRHELDLAQANKRTALEGDGEAGREMARMREEWEQERVAWRDRENQLLYELNRLSANPSATALLPARSPRAAQQDDRGAYIDELQQLLRERESQLQQQSDKLAWYAENQQLLSDSQAALDQAHQRIKQLERQAHSVSPTKGRSSAHAATGATEGRSLPADVKRIRQLEKEVQQLQRRLSTPAASGVDRDDAAMAGLLVAAKGGEEGEVARELRSRVAELEAEVKAREEEWERRLRAMRQEQDKIRAGFEKKVRVLQEGVKGRLAQLKGKRGLGSVAASSGEAAGATGGVDEVVKAMEARMQAMREQYERRIEEMQAVAEQSHEQPHRSPASPPRPSSVGSTASRTPLRSALRSAARPQRSASTSRLHSPTTRTRPTVTQQINTAASAHDAGGTSQPVSPRAAQSAAAASVTRAHHAPHHGHAPSLPSSASASNDGAADLDAHFQQLHTLLHSSHRSDLTALASHYTQLLTTLQQHTRAQLDAMQQRLAATEADRQRLADAVGALQADVWRSEREAEERGWEVERYKERPGVREYALLERQVREMEARMERREREYREEADMAMLRAEEERVRTVERFESIVKRKNEQLRAFEHEMEQLIDLLHKTQQQLAAHSNRRTAAAAADAQSGGAQAAALREREEREAVGGSVDGGGAAVGVVNYVALLERLEAQQSAVYQQLTAQHAGKENRGRAALSAKSAVGKPMAGAVSGAVAHSDKTAFARRASVGPHPQVAGSVRRQIPAQSASRRAQ